MLRLFDIYGGFFLFWRERGGWWGRGGKKGELGEEERGNIVL